ncbi:unnamed protein product [Auanema sp. JU1783]|nr:unnamed protein product [Auanema sp. JU1783]
MFALSRLVSRLPVYCVAEASFSSAGDGLSVRRAKLLYQSKKRGILENDILLGEFAEKNLQSMNKQALDDYDKLINGDHMEWDLFYYLSGKKTPPEDLAASPMFQQMKAFVDKKRGL